MLFCTGSLKEWTLILYGTSQNPHQQPSVQLSYSKTLENPEVLEEPELQEEEEEEEYNGEKIHPSTVFYLVFPFFGLQGSWCLFPAVVVQEVHKK